MPSEESDSKPRASSHLRWLYRELPELEAGGVVDGATAERIRRHYGAPDRGLQQSWLLLVFGVLGALLVGGGAILLLAHNWESLSRATRTVISFLPLLGVQAATAWVLWRSQRPLSLAGREGLAVAWTVAIGACLALVSQTYHLPWDVGGLALRWSLLTLPVPYLLSSSPIPYLVGITAWGLTGWEGDPSRLWSYPLLVLVAPLIWRQLHTEGTGAGAALTLWASAAAPLILLFRAFEGQPTVIWFVGYALLLALYLAIDQLLFRDRGAFRRSFGAIGFAGIAGFGVALTFEEPWRQLGDWTAPLEGPEDAVRWSLLALLALGYGWAARGLASGRRRGIAPSSLLWAAFPLVVLAAATFVFSSPGLPAVSQAGLNLYLFAVGLVTTIDGVRRSRLETTNLGVLVLAVLFGARFFDWQLGFVLRGVLFILIGTGFLAFNYWAMRRWRTGG